MDQIAGDMQNFSLLMFLMDKLIFKIIQGEEQPQNYHTGKSPTHSTTQLPNRKLLPKKQAHL